ncbi:DUF742 domain-containing protein [Kitasatospora sp. YST-16]|uniref:DUF742 domain-containing protein n=1 Tax=Kitasatospora sp. YST-16 TaxID=2998080 RepID=UPI00228491A3|nr:DUF742 domain-containing protein [Kitasatospora sp. YST-16]WAL74657.1 DUF742 domain-containing protein [Kitasatospora sp. YST-16]WNW40715.1 DUF742 domain-containing protein [Streptomyces sp. Li-HN-5-13]
MTHWSQEAEEDGLDTPFVRPYTVTGGRAAPGSDAMELITLISALPAPEASSRYGLQPEHHAILELCRRPLAVVEIAARLDLPVSVTKILIGDLVDAGRAHARTPVASVAGGLPDVAVLRAVRDGLRRL